MSPLLLSSLPQDIIIIICEFSTRTDLLSIRQLCNTFYNAASLVLAKNIYLSMRPDRFAIPKTWEKYARSVTRSVIIDGCLLEYELYREFGIDESDCLEWAKVEKWQAYIEHDNPFKSIFGILRKDLEELSFSCLRHGSGNPFAYFHGIPNEFPEQYYFGAPQFEALMESIIEHNITFKSLQLHGLEWPFLQSPLAHYAFTRTLTSLSIDIHLGPESLDDDDTLPCREMLRSGTLSKLLHMTPNLRMLSLRFENHGYVQSHAAYLEEIINDHSWLEIRNISLGGIMVTETGLTSMLKRYSKTLQGLEISDLTFREGQWISFLQKLPKFLNLKSAHIYGHFCDIIDHQDFGKEREYPRTRLRELIESHMLNTIHI